MGLDCTAISKIAYVGVGNHGDPTDEYYEADAGYCQDDNHIQVFAYADHAPHALAGMKITANTCGPGFVGGDCYTATGDSESFGWRAGSYGGYNDFRNRIAGIAEGRRDQEYWNANSADWPFYELVYFADNEGVLGTRACQNLLADFRQYRDKWVATYGPDDDDSWEVERYDEWVTALELGANNGVIIFH